MTTNTRANPLPDVLVDTGLPRSVLRGTDDVVLVVADDGTLVYANAATESVLGRAPVGLRGEPVASVLADSGGVDGHAAIRACADDPDPDVAWGDAELALRAADGSRVPVLADVHDHVTPAGRYLVVVCRDVSECRRLERERDQFREERDRIERVDSLVRDVSTALVRADDREAIERAVVERFAEGDGTTFAWFGRPRVASADVQPVAWAADDADASAYLDVVDVTSDDASTGRGPAGRALDSRAVTTVSDVREDPAFAPWRDAALDRGFRSVAAVPVAVDDVVYGVVCLYADETAAFEGESTVLSELGRSIASAIEATEQRRLLYADTLLELELRVTDDASPLVRATDALDCTLTLDGFVPGDGPAVLYVDVDGVAPETFVETADAALERARVVSERDDGGRLELAVAGGDVVSTLAVAGARVESGVVANGDAHFVVQTAPDADVRGIVDHVRRVHPDVDLVSKREVERRPRAFADVRDEVADRLTDRQHTALRTAYYAGYLEWPRESSGEDVAGTMGVSPPTFYQHFRAGERKLFDAFFDDE